MKKSVKLNTCEYKNSRMIRKRMAIALSFLLGSSVIQARTITVSPEKSSGCTLTDAILSANRNQAIGNCQSGLGADTIELPESHLFSFLKAFNENSSSALPVITEELTINGHASIIERAPDAQTQFRLLATASPKPIKRMFTLTLNDLTLRNGALGKNSSEKCGGAIKTNANQFVRLNRSIVTQNKAFQGGGICGSADLVDSTISFNSAFPDHAFSFGEGGGMFSPNGWISIQNSTILDNYGLFGGGIDVENSELNISDSMIKNNTALYGAGINIQYCAENEHATTINRSIITGNNAENNGGGADSACKLSVIETMIADNSAEQYGGGILSSDKSSILLNSTLSGNTAGLTGGGVFSFYTFAITNSTLSGNTALYKGGGANGDFFIRNSTISGNTANRGGGLNTRFISLDHVTIVNNDANEGGGIFLDNFIKNGRTSEARNSVISNNTGKDCFSNQTDQLDNPINLDPNISNWFGDDSCDGIASGDTGLAALSDNGGPTLTHALLPDSPLINAGNTSVCFDSDQRGALRLNDQLCDIGAFEQTDLSALPLQQQPLIVAGTIAIDHRISHILFPEPGAFEQPPVVILGPMSFNGINPAVTRINRIDNAGFDVKIQEYNYLNGDHAVESIDYQAIQPGVYHFNDPVSGDEIIIEAGFFEVNTNAWHQQNFVADFAEPPVLLTTVTSNRGIDAVTERVRNVTQNGFKARLFEEEKLQSSGHVLEKVGFIAYHLPSVSTNLIDVNGQLRRFEKHTTQFDHTWGDVPLTLGKLQLKVEEERSLDKEVKHLKENINILKIERLLFAEDISNRGLNTSSLRKR
jgi:hypothetical protein